MKKLILASQSPRRRELLEKAGYAFDTIPSHADETMDPKLSHRENVCLIARRKALDVARHHRGIILAADTVVLLDKEVFGKPKDQAHAIEMLHRFSGTTHEVVTAFILYDTDTPQVGTPQLGAPQVGAPRVGAQREISKTVSTFVTFRILSPEEIESYVVKHRPYDKAGGYAIQEEADAFVEKIEGSYSNVVGLPMDEISAALRVMGYELPSATRP